MTEEKRRNQGGRPSKSLSEKRAIKWGFNASVKESIELREMLSKTDLDKAEFIRRAVFGIKIKANPLPTEEQFENMRYLTGACKNLNQLMKFLHKNKSQDLLPGMIPRIEETLTKINKHLDAL